MPPPVTHHRITQANGEAAHLSVRRVGDRFVLFPGSKNVHIAVCRRTDIALYLGERYCVASSVAGAIFDTLDQISLPRREELFSFMAATRYTATFEMLQPDYQHVVFLPQTTQLHFIAWTSTRLQRQMSLCSINPVVGLEIARHLGLTPVPYQVLPMAELEPRMAAIRSGYNSEGDVLYFLDSHGAVMGLLKKKTAW